MFWGTSIHQEKVTGFWERWTKSETEGRSVEHTCQKRQVSYSFKLTREFAQTIDPLVIKACPYFYRTQTWVKWIVCIMWKNIPKLATSCNLRVIAVKASKLELYRYKSLKTQRALTAMTLKLQLLILGCSFTWYKLFILFMFVYDKNKDTPLWIGSIGFYQLTLMKVYQMLWQASYSISPSLWQRVICSKCQL